MKNKSQFLLCFMLFIGFATLAQAQTLFAPGGTVGTSNNTKVGIGTASPASNLHVYAASNPAIRLNNNTGDWFQIGAASCNGCFATKAQTGDIVMRHVGAGDLLIGVTHGSVSNRSVKFISTNDVLMTIFDNGRVGIGTTDIPSAYKLAVADGIITEKVKVAIEGSSQWADYVFEKDYQLRSLQEVESFISENGHLPDVPSAEEVVNSGIDLGTMNATLLRKIEENTLYLIQLQKENQALKSELSELKSK